MFDKKNVASIASWLNLLLPENKGIIYLRGKCRLKFTLTLSRSQSKNLSLIDNHTTAVVLT